MTVSRHLLYWALLTCCQGAATVSDGDASAPTRDRSTEMAAPESGFEDDETSAHTRDRLEEMAAPDSGFVDDDAPPPIQGRPEEMPSADSGFSYLQEDTYSLLKEKMKHIPLPNKKLLPHLTEKFFTVPVPSANYPKRFREVHVGADKDLMHGVKLYRSARPGFSEDSKDMAIYLFDTGFLQSLNVKNIINLNPLEFSSASKFFIKEAGIHVDHIPIVDFEAPTTEQIWQAINSIEKARKANKSSWIFCGFGDGRTGTIVASYEVWMISQAYPDLTGQELLMYVMRRSGYVKFARELLNFDDDQITTLLNAYDTHKIEMDWQVDAVLTFADQITKMCIVNK